MAVALHSSTAFSHCYRKRLEFDTEKLTVDDLREELRLRGLATSGSKTVLLERLEEAIATRGDIALHRLANVCVKIFVWLFNFI
jgi:hypothetical protein